MIDKPFPTADAWTAFFIEACLPVLRHTTHQLHELRENAMKSNARTIASVIQHDPLMTLRMLAYIESKRSKSRVTDINTIERGLMMIGMGPFFRDFENLPLIEDELKGYPRAMLGLLKVINRSRKAVQWAHDWALYRHDLDVNEIVVATLLYDFPEILMWSFAPGLSLKAVEIQQKNSQLRSVMVQTEVFGTPLYEIKQSLAIAWKLPPLLTALMDPQHAEHPRVRNVKLAVDLARHSANGWSNPAIPDDLKGISELIHINEAAVIRKLGLEEFFPIEDQAPEAS